MTFAVQTETTCAIACWMAREPECRCSCGGKNHGVLLVDGAEQPRRNAMIKGTRYVLGAMGFIGAMRQTSRKFRDSLDHSYGDTRPSGYYIAPQSDVKGGTTWERLASADQSMKWPEVVAWIEGDLTKQQQDVVAAIEEIKSGGLNMAGLRYRAEARPRARRPQLLWIREDLIEQFDVWQEEQ